MNRATAFSLLVILAGAAARSFVVNGSSFVKDGEPFQIISGSVHYFRHHPSTFAQRLGMARLCGLNAVQTYISWTIHEPTPGHYERLDEIGTFLTEAQAQGLLVVLRPGPYICAESEGGGLPGWLQVCACCGTCSSQVDVFLPATF
jgi:beta-galactosidase